MEKIKVIINNEQKEIKIPTGLRMIIRRCCIAVLKTESFKGSAQVSVTFVDNDKMKELNKKYRSKDSTTDVLSFSTKEGETFATDPETGAKIIGDVVISIEEALDQAQKYGYSLQREIGFLVAHSVLHLLGYDHEKGGIEKAKMREKEELIMAKLGFPGTASYFLDKNG